MFFAGFYIGFQKGHENGRSSGFDEGVKATLTEMDRFMKGGTEITTWLGGGSTINERKDE